MKVFIVDDERIIRVSLVDDFRDEGYQVWEFASATSALAQIKEHKPQIIITDVKMPEMSGIEFLKKIKEFDPNITVILMTAFSTVSDAVQVMQLGAQDYITKPFDNQKLVNSVNNIRYLNKIKIENKTQVKKITEKFDFSSYVGSSEMVQQVFELIEIVASKSTTVLITGETGTGKELITNVIHHNSNRKDKPLIKVSCAILSREIFESELFGHEKGSFTGADDKKIGRFELADTGTIYLDDIDDVPLDLQVKLLRALEEREIERVGSKQAVKIDIRVIASTKKDLRELVEQGKFREDLYYRLNVFPINLSPLRSRGSDVIELTKYFVDKFSENEKIEIDKEVFDALLNYNFPGNTRELKNLCERLVLLSKNNRISAKSLPLYISASEVKLNSENFENKPLNEIMEDIEKNIIENAMNKAGGNKAKAAEILGIPASTLKSKLSKIS